MHAIGMLRATWAGDRLGVLRALHNGCKCLWLSLHETESSARNILCGSGHMMAFFYAHITCSLGSPRGGGGGFKPYCLRLSLRQSAIGTYCVGLDIKIMMAFFYAH